MRKEAEEHNRAPEKEIPVEISAFGIERSLVPGRNVHPCVKMVAEEKNWHKEQRQDHQQCREILQLTSHHYRPLGVGGMMDDCPEKAAGAEGEEKCKGKEP